MFSDATGLLSEEMLAEIHFIFLIAVTGLVFLLTPLPIFILCVLSAGASIVGQLISNNINGASDKNTLFGAFIGGLFTPLGIQGVLFAGIYNATWNQIEYMVTNNINDISLRVFLIETTGYTFANGIAYLFSGKNVAVNSLKYIVIDAIAYTVVDALNHTLS